MDQQKMCYFITEKRKKYFLVTLFYKAYFFIAAYLFYVSNELVNNIRVKQSFKTFKFSRRGSKQKFSHTNLSYCVQWKTIFIPGLGVSAGACCHIFQEQKPM